MAGFTQTLMRKYFPQKPTRAMNSRETKLLNVFVVSLPNILEREEQIKKSLDNFHLIARSEPPRRNP